MYQEIARSQVAFLHWSADCLWA